MFVKDFFKAVLYQPFFNLLVFFAWLVPGHSIGWAIILLTIVVRVILWVPSAKSIKAPLQMNQYRDEIKAIQERHKDDRVAQSQAVMAFYKEKGINPLAGCLPLLIQLPVILILYRVFIVGLQDVRPDLIYSFTPHLETINTYFMGINLAQPERIVLPIIAGGLQYFQSRQLQQLNPTVGSGQPNDPAVIMSKQMQYLFPVMTFFIAMTLPAGLALYWATSTLFSIVQQTFIARTYKPVQAAATVTVRSKKK